MDSSENLIIKAYAADLLKNQVSYLENQIEGLIYDENIEFLHHTRVMSRRIRNTISVFAPYFGKKNAKRWFAAFRKLTKSLTQMRDLDVQILFLENKISEIKEQKLLTGLQRIMLRKQQQREKKQETVHAAILQFEKTKVLSEIKTFIEKNPMDQENFTPTASLVQLGKDEVDTLIKTCFSFVPFITNPDQKEPLHDLRIAIKNLRYTTELFKPILPELDASLTTMKKFQDDLGEIHDCDVWIDNLDSFMEKEKRKIQNFYGQSGPFNFIKPGIVFLMDQLKSRKIDIHNQFLTRWHEEYQHEFWANLQLVFEEKLQSIEN
ncbi:MAG TPA: CHAD domain-containing protein [Anaerolineaceae bacterium]|nr:CHAD domain-containing protein [Anaerolineaceae bacterium]